jgi:uncharacterized protein with HEPN domain
MKSDHLERNPRLYLTEIIESIAKIETYTKGLSTEAFVKDPLRIDAVDANLRNIGEATRVLAKHCCSLLSLKTQRLPRKYAL